MLQEREKYKTLKQWAFFLSSRKKDKGKENKRIEKQKKKINEFFFKENERTVLETPHPGQFHDCRLEVP
jgi:hypothetical protein